MMVVEVLGGIVLFFFLSMLSFILLPSIFGCFGFILFLAVFLALIVFFSASIGWFILVALIGYFILGLVRLIRYVQLPDYDTYLATSHAAYASGAAQCNSCGCSQLIHQGLFGPQSKFRYYRCLGCRKLLYKFKVL